MSQSSKYSYIHVLCYPVYIHDTGIPVTSDEQILFVSTQITSTDPHSRHHRAHNRPHRSIRCHRHNVIVNTAKQSDRARYCFYPTSIKSIGWSPQTIITLTCYVIESYGSQNGGVMFDSFLLKAMCFDDVASKRNLV